MSSRSILLVEPPESDRPIYAECLRANGFTVTEVESTDDGASRSTNRDRHFRPGKLSGQFPGRSARRVG